MGRTLFLFALGAATLAAADSDYERAHSKLERISNYQLKPGETVVFTPAEINAWARVAVPETVPEGIRNPRVELGAGTATGSALVDLLKMRQAQGKATNPLIAKMLEGERPLKIFVRLESGGGRCTVYLTRVELGNASAEGAILDFLVKNFFLPLFPDAKIDEPFDLGYDMKKIELRPDGVRVTMKNSR
ncbi:MAG TPA: hypothetical protein VH639_19265 [Bryobacteraceae bacterium]